ncbi:hypothetical protein [Paraburkholderia pallida]|uniref:Uncharacterized protein n=1 Tax=Paraburkholderia pallida TaxID=2547399 RepID=A0A4P7DB18_9BURK|nr:hypothetical protein [Paraburkholderia pallida]QBR04430.1 hypothetical protein E1956_45975 [Paraburkholderia pallida]
MMDITLMPILAGVYDGHREPLTNLRQIVRKIHQGISARGCGFHFKSPANCDTTYVPRAVDCSPGLFGQRRDNGFTMTEGQVAHTTQMGSRIDAVRAS